LVDVLTNLNNALVVALWLYVDDEARIIGRANNPPIRESGIGAGEQKRGYE
jgi:hypothetical protein